MFRSKKESAIAAAMGQNVACVGKAQDERSVGKTMALIGVLSAGMTAGAAQAAITVPTELLDVFTDLGLAFATLMGAGAVLFGVIRGGIALFKIASRVFSAAGA